MADAAWAERGRRWTVAKSPPAIDTVVLLAARLVEEPRVVGGRIILRTARTAYTGSSGRLGCRWEAVAPASVALALFYSY